MDLSNSVTNERALVYMAKDLSPVPDAPEITEELKIWRLPLNQAFDMVHRGEIKDAISVAALLYVQLKKNPYL